MSDVSSGGGNSGLYFIVGALVVVVLGAILYFGGYFGHTGTSSSRSTTIERSISPAPGGETSTTTVTRQSTSEH